MQEKTAWKERQVENNGKPKIREEKILKTFLAVFAK